VTPAGLPATSAETMADRTDIPVLAPPAEAPAAVDVAAELARAIGPTGDWPNEWTVAVNDPQRHTDSRRVLDALASVAGDAGRPAAVHLIVACGTHRFGASARAEFEGALTAGSAVAVRSITWHDCRDRHLAPVGPEGRWRTQRSLVEGDGAVLAVGSVEPHYFAGLTGAHKTVTVGCADFAAIEANHAGAMSPEARPFALAGNPVYDRVAAMVGALRRRREVLAVNLLQVGPRVLAAAAGNPTAALDALAPAAEAAFCHRLDAPADALILEVSGPLAGSFYQADKAVKNAEFAVRDGGLLVLCAACPDGIGQDHFVDLLRRADRYAAAVAIVADRGYRLGDHKAVRLRRLTDPSERGVRVTAVSAGLGAEACAVLGFEKAPTPAEALAAGGIVPGRDRVFRVADAANSVVLPPRN